MEKEVCVKYVVDQKIEIIKEIDQEMIYGKDNLIGLCWSVKFVKTFLGCGFMGM